MDQLNETKLSRVWQLFTDDTRSVAVLTAFRGEFNREDNLKRNAALAADLRNAGFGITYVEGHWIENQGSDLERNVVEDSILVSGPRVQVTEFAKIIHRLGNTYDQEAVLVKDSKGTRLIFNDGSEEKLGDLRPGKLGQIYTKLRTNKQASTFVFEGEREAISWIKKLAGISK